MLTGESFPVTKKPGDSVIGGTSNKQVSSRSLSPSFTQHSTNMNPICILGCYTCQGHSSWRRDRACKNCTACAGCTDLQGAYPGTTHFFSRNFFPIYISYSKAFADKVSGVFVPFVLLISGITFGIWLTLALTVLPDDWIDTNPYLFAFNFGITVLVYPLPFL